MKKLISTVESSLKKATKKFNKHWSYDLKNDLPFCAIRKKDEENQKAKELLTLLETRKNTEFKTLLCKNFQEVSDHITELYSVMLKHNKAAKKNRIRQKIFDPTYKQERKWHASLYWVEIQKKLEWDYPFKADIVFTIDDFLKHKSTNHVNNTLAYNDKVTETVKKWQKNYFSKL